MINVENYLQTKRGLELGEDGRKVLASRLSNRQTDRQGRASTGVDWREDPSPPSQRNEAMHGCCLDVIAIAEHAWCQNLPTVRAFSRV